MRGYLNKTCDCCGEKFKEEDDIVVCPDCGTPIHRSCWSGHCPNEERHAEGFDWDKEQEKQQKAEKRHSEYKYCLICRNRLSPDDDIVVCDSCGSLMHRRCREAAGYCPKEPGENAGYSPYMLRENAGTEGSEQARGDYDPDVSSFYISDEASFEEFVKQLRRLDEQSGEERTCFGVKHIEMLHFLGIRSISTPRFFSLFFNMAQTGRKVSLNFFAGLLMPFYQFYRKMVGPSIVLALAYMILSIPQMVITLIMGLHGNETLIPAELYTMLDVFFYILLVLRIIMALFNDYIYMRWSVGKILALREQYQGRPENEYMEALERAGRPKFAFVIIGVTSVHVLLYILVGIMSSMGYFA